MHEHGITNEVIHQVLHACEDSNILNPNKIILNLGQLTSYKKEPILFYFEGIRKDYPQLINSELLINEIPGQIHCKECNEKNRVEYTFMVFCPKCKSMDVDIIDGDKIEIVSIE